MSARTTRRQLLGAPAAMLLLGCAEAGEAKARELDGELLAACAHYRRLEAAYRATGAGEADMVCPDGYDEAVWAVAELPARTPEGLQAKAEAIFAWHGGYERHEGDEDEIAPHEAMEWSLILDVAGRARA